MRCQDAKLEMLAYLGGELTEAEAGAVKEHLLVCPSCSREFVAMQAAERDLKEGLEQTNFPGKGRLGAWAVRQADKLSAKEISRRREWVAGLPTYEALLSQSLKRPRKSFFSTAGLKAAALAAVLTVLLFAFWPQVVQVSAQVPVLGDWVRMKVYKDAGIGWAYEHGYISRHPESVSRNGAKLSILGIVADPIQTTVIYLVEGTDEQPPVNIKSESGINEWSYFDQQVNTPLGIVGMVHFTPLPPEEQQLKVESKKLGLAIDLAVTREPVSRVAQEYDLDFEESVGKTKIRINRLIYTPAQVRVEYFITHNVYVSDIGFNPLPKIILTDHNGNRMLAPRKHITNQGNEWKGYVEFNRPSNVRNMSLSIGQWDIYQLWKINFTPEDVGKKLAVGDSALTLVAWERSGPVWGSEDILELQLKCDGWIQGLKKWQAEGYSPSVLQENFNGNIAVGFRLPKDPEQITADLIHAYFPDYWEIPLPAD